MQEMAQQSMVVLSGSLKKCSTTLLAGFKGGLRSKVVLGPFSLNRSYHLGPGQYLNL